MLGRSDTGQTQHQVVVVVVMVGLLPLGLLLGQRCPRMVKEEQRAGQWPPTEYVPHPRVKAHGLGNRVHPPAEGGGGSPSAST